MENKINTADEIALEFCERFQANYPNEPIHQMMVDLTNEIKQYAAQFHPTVTDEEIERMVAEIVKENKNNPNAFFENGVRLGFKAAQSRLSQPVTGYSEEYLPDKKTVMEAAWEIFWKGKRVKDHQNEFFNGFMTCYEYFKSLKSKPNTNTEE